MSRTWAYLSNYLVYSSMAVYTISFFAHAIETAWAVRLTTEDSKQTLDYKRTEKVARIATAMMILGFVLLVAGVIARGLSAGRVPWGNMYEFSITGAMACCRFCFLISLASSSFQSRSLNISLSLPFSLSDGVT